MNLNIEGKTALIVGGSRGLGLGVAEALAAEGCKVALLARDPAALEEATKKINQKGVGHTTGFSADLADAGSVAQTIDEAEKVLGGHIDILLNNSGGPPPSGVANLDPKLWEQQFHAMVLSVFRITDRILPGMRQRQWGRILTVASATVQEPNPLLGISNTLRSALAGWSKTLATEVARDGITVNMLLPGSISTARTAQLDAAAATRQGSTLEAVNQAKAAAIPVGRYGTTAEFGAVAAFLASEQAAYVTGSMIRVDGGALRSL